MLKSSVFYVTSFKYCFDKGKNFRVADTVTQEGKQDFVVNVVEEAFNISLDNPVVPL